MDTIYYTLKVINGEYATLISDKGIETCVALAFLPLEADIDCHIKWENLEYTLVN